MEGCIYSVLDTQIEDENPLACVTLHVHAFGIRVEPPKLLSKPCYLFRSSCLGHAETQRLRWDPTLRILINRQVSSQVPPLDVVEGRVYPKSPRPIHQHHCRADPRTSDCPFGVAEDTAC